MLAEAFVEHTWERQSSKVNNNKDCWKVGPPGDEDDGVIEFIETA